MPNPTPAKRLHDLARRLDLRIEEFSPGLRIWSVYAATDWRRANCLAFGVPHSDLRAKLVELRTNTPAVEILTS